MVAPDVEPATDGAFINLGGPLTVNLTPGALAAHGAFEESLGHARGRHRVAALEPFMAKAPDLAGRLALVLHLAQWASEGAGGDVGDVQRATMESAIRLITDYCIPSWERVIALVSSTPQANHAVMVDERAREKGWASVSPRLLSRSGWRGLATAMDCTKALKELVDHGRVLPPDREAVNERGGRPPKSYAVNPRLLLEWWGVSSVTKTPKDGS
jgi:hypothetical protein